jgi:hypothetical protein
MDHKNLPILVLPPRGPAVTPWLTTIVDDGTRGLVGWAIAITPHHQKATRTVQEQNVVVAGRSLGVLKVLANDSPHCGLVWGSFWTNQGSVHFTDEGITHLKLTFAQASPPSSSNYVCEWTPESDTCAAPSEMPGIIQETWTPAMRIVPSVDYSATLLVTMVAG